MRMLVLISTVTVPPGEEQELLDRSNQLPPEVVAAVALQAMDVALLRAMV